MSTSQIIYITGARLAFPALIEPEPYQDNPPRYSCDLILPSNDPIIQRIMSEIGQVANATFKEHAQAVLQNCQNNRKLRCWGDGSEKINQKTFQIYDGYGPGTFFLTAASKPEQPPQIVRPEDGKAIDNINTMERSAAARKLYGGCYVNAAVFFWAQDNKHGKGIRAQLVAVQFSKDGESFGMGTPDVSGMFQPQAPQQPGFGQPQPMGFNPYQQPPQPQQGQFNPYQQSQQPQQVPGFLNGANTPGVKMPWEY